MAVNNSTILSVCLYCKTNSQIDSEKEFHEIFDEVGLELQLPTLVETFFHKKLINEGKQLLCEDCVNRLIELYDLEEHAKEEKNEKDVGNNVISSSEGRQSENDGLIIKNVKPGIVISNVCEESEIPKVCVFLNNKINVVETKNIRISPYNEKQKVDASKNTESYQYDGTNSNKTHPLIQNQESEPTNDCFQYEEDEVLPNSEDIALPGDEVSYDLTVDDDTNNEIEEIDPINEIEIIQCDGREKQISKHSIKDLKHYEDQELEQINEIENVKSDKEYNEQNIFHQIEPDTQHDKDPEIELEINKSEITYDLSTDEDAESEVQIIENLADENTVEGNETPCKALQVLENQTVNSEEHANHNEVLTVQETTNTDSVYCLEQNDIIEEHIYEDDAEEEFILVPISQKSNDDMNFDDIEEFEEFENDDDNQEVFIESNTVNTNVIEEVSELSQDNNTVMEIDDAMDLVLQDTQINHGDVVVMEIRTENPEYENMTTEEEYLLEELICSEEFDCVDLNEYFDNNVMTKFELLELQWPLDCKLCLQKYDTLQDVLKHSCINDLFENKKTGCCIIKDCEEITNDLKSLARHLIIQHYKNIESLPIYSRCCDCEKSFSNFIDLNKHSCCRTIKRKAGARNFCQSCNMDFQSLKRYIFHMQFHLTKHRPKVCLLCGALFNNSNDFFNHTQYNHEPDTAMACIICDRFFKDKVVYEKHMELHDESKYIHACSHCPKMYTKKYNLTMHMDVYHNLKTKSMECEYCDKEFATNSSYRYHMKSHEPEAEVPAFVCSECGLIASSGDIIQDHIEMDKKSPCNTAMIIEEILSVGYTCENCSMDFRTKQHLQKHRLSTNHSDKCFYCFLCRKSFKSLRHMRNHVICHKDYEQWEIMFPILRLYMCNIENCQDSYPLWSSLYYHKKKPHKKDKELLQDFKCQFCQQSCPTKMSLAVHVARSHKSSIVSCSYCKKKFKNNKILQDHIDKFHIAVKCSVCDRDFKNRRNLDAHEISVHHNLKRFYCQYCEKGYFYKSELENHVKNVHPETSYKCEVCNFATNYPKSLEIHLNNHNNERKFKCTICSKSFGRKQQLTIHMKSHEEFVCSNFCEQGCNALFLSLSLLKTHIRTVHENPKEDPKKVNTIKRKRSSQKIFDVVETEDATISILLEDIDKTVKRRKRKAELLMKDIDIEKDSIDLTLNEIPEDDHISSHDFIIQCEDEVSNTSE